jgi:hypothetical protein
MTGNSDRGRGRGVMGGEELVQFGGPERFAAENSWEASDRMLSGRQRDEKAGRQMGK